MGIEWFRFRCLYWENKLACVSGPIGNTSVDLLTNWLYASLTTFMPWQQAKLRRINQSLGISHVGIVCIERTYNSGPIIYMKLPLVSLTSQLILICHLTRFARSLTAGPVSQSMTMASIIAMKKDRKCECTSCCCSFSSSCQGVAGPFYWSVESDLGVASPPAVLLMLVISAVISYCWQVAS